MKRSFYVSVLFSEKQCERYRTYYGVIFHLERECFVYSNDAQVWGERFIHTHLIFKAYVSGFPRVEKTLHHSKLKWDLATSTHTLQKLAISHTALTYFP